MKNKFLTTTEHQKGVLSLVLLSFVFASMGLFSRYLSTGFELFQQVYLRMFSALLIGMFVFRKDIAYKKYLNIPKKDIVVIIFRAVSFSLVGIVLFTKALLITKYANVSFIGSLPLTAVFGFLLLHEKFSLKKVAYILFAFIGVLLISVTDYSNLFKWGYGEILTLVSAIFFSLSYIARKWQTDYLNNKELTVANFFVSAIIIFIASIAYGEGMPVDGWNFGLLLAVIGAGAFNTVNNFLTNYGFQKVKAVLASNILTLESFFAIILGLFVYKEVPTLKELIGGLIITVSVLGMNKVENLK